MIIPLDLLVGQKDNAYEFTCAIIKRAVQITATGDEEIDANNGKIVSTAIKQVLVKNLEYRIEE